MATSFDSIEDQALVVINDYRLAKLYNQSEADFKLYLDGFLMKATQDFMDCDQSLAYDATNRQFTVDLTMQEQSILADYVVIEWYQRDNNTSALYRQHLQNSGSFKNHSEASAIKEHSTVLDKLREEVDRKVSKYCLSSYVG